VPHCLNEDGWSMNTAKPQRSYLEELKAFLLFLKNLWGLLAGISVFFPLSNVLLKAIPLGAYGNDGVFDQLSPSLLTSLATVTTLFVVLMTFTGRHRFQEPQKRASTLRAACLTFGIGILALLSYLIIHQVYREYAWEPWGWGSGDPRKLFAEIPLLITYVIFFSMFTRAFMLLGMLEFFGNPNKSGQSDQQNVQDGGKSDS
jgi:hypothetical protein